VFENPRNAPSYRPGPTWKRTEDLSMGMGKVRGEVRRCAVKNVCRNRSNFSISSIPSSQNGNPGFVHA
jgi:hypothetical protein